MAPGIKEVETSTNSRLQSSLRPVLTTASRQSEPYLSKSLVAPDTRKEITLWDAMRLHDA